MLFTLSGTIADERVARERASNKSETSDDNEEEDGAEWSCVAPAIQQFPYAGLDKGVRQKVRTIPEIINILDNFDSDTHLQDVLPLDFIPSDLTFSISFLQGGLLIHILTAVYMFMGLAIVADDYFVPALDKLAESKFTLFAHRVKIRKFSLVFTKSRVERVASLDDFTNANQT